ncbi:MAG: signal recognition particle-docking protein FtsY [Cetobacterium sp.]|uniref:signal recognition particle-docking protein FtsY n=2 Tax=Fusobacteriaceae TaxID=203492 RepID=UPI001F052948|nr:signal recognition particle-docking protein FtsY [Cetobacterium somerae]MCX3067387.1 signal recognition particle-docking protein FtsY [Cetobacterium somerae]UPO97711.1 signal recognition particle-docking protein FtsY [Cetobacterium somerae]
MGFFNKLFGRKKEDKVEEKEEKLEHEVIEEEIESLEELKEEKIDEEERIDEAVEKAIDDEKNEESTIENEEIKDEIVYIEKPKVEKRSFFTSLKEKLFKSREGLFGTLKNIFTGKSIVDGEMYEELEDTLVQSDIGIEMTLKIVKDLKAEVKARGVKKPEDVYPVLKDVLEGYLITENTKLDIQPGRMNVILIVGVNGVGKTTTIGKIAAKLVKDGKKVVIGAADTFRAAAVEQLEEWVKRAGAEIVKHPEGADPGAVVFDTLKAGEDKNADVVIIDTAGRLHNKNNLMKELEKINNIIKKKIGDQPYESILVLDGTTGQNGLIQARVFNEVTKLTGFIVTKLDGTAKGGILFSISEELKKPIKYIGVGEGIEDLREFNSKEYIQAIFD